MYGGEAVHAGGEVIGRVRSCAYGFTVRRNVALAKLPAALERGAPPSRSRSSVGSCRPRSPTTCSTTRSITASVHNERRRLD